MNIAVLELFPITLALQLWPRELKDREIVFWSDSMSVVHAVKAQIAKCPILLGLIRELNKACLYGTVDFHACYLQGVKNTAADALSRFQWERFQLACLEADQEMTPFQEDWWRLVQWNPD